MSLLGGWNLGPKNEMRSTASDWKLCNLWRTFWGQLLAKLMVDGDVPLYGWVMSAGCISRRPQNHEHFQSECFQEMVGGIFLQEKPICGVKTCASYCFVQSMITHSFLSMIGIAYEQTSMDIEEPWGSLRKWITFPQIQCMCGVLLVHTCPAKLLTTMTITDILVWYLCQNLVYLPWQRIQWLESVGVLMNSWWLFPWKLP